MEMTLKPNSCRPLVLHLTQLSKILVGCYSRIPAIFNCVILIYEHGGVGVQIMSCLENLSRGISSKPALNEIKMHVFIDNIPSDHLALVSCNDGVDSLLDSGPQLILPEGVDPVELILWVVPKDVVTPDWDAIFLRKRYHGVCYRVVLLALDVLNGVPLHLILEDGDRKSAREPVLVGHIVEDRASDGAPKWKACLFYTDRNYCTCKASPVRIGHMEPDPGLTCLHEFINLVILRIQRKWKIKMVHSKI